MVQGGEDFFTFGHHAFSRESHEIYAVLARLEATDDEPLLGIEH